MELRGARVLVVGLARSGQSAVELLLEHGAKISVTDSRPPAELQDVLPALEARGVAFSPQCGQTFENVDLVVISPGVPADLAELQDVRRRGVPVVGEVELAGWFLQGPTIGITGSNGKTTTTALIGHIMQHAGIPAQVGGNIGRPLCSMVGESRPDQWNVLELSSFQLETIVRFRCRIAVGMNLTPDHLDRHHTWEAYVAAKRRMFETQTVDDDAVLNADDATCVSYAGAGGRAHWFSATHEVSPGAWLNGSHLLLGGELLMAAAEVPLRGRHNLENVMAAAVATRLAGASTNAIREAVRSFPGVEHRLEYVCTLRGVDIYNDSKATNVDAALKAIDAFDGPLWVILGGKDKDSDYRPLREPLASKCRAALLIGAAEAKIASQLSGAVRLESCGTLQKALELSFAEARPGETILLAPACASFDQFENFEHRGRVFKSLARTLGVGC